MADPKPAKRAAKNKPRQEREPPRARGSVNFPDDAEEALVERSSEAREDGDEDAIAAELVDESEVNMLPVPSRPLREARGDRATPLARYDPLQAFMRDLKAQGAIINFEVYADTELNTASQLEQGKVYWNIRFTDVPPAENPNFRVEVTNQWLTEVLDART